MTNQSLPEMKYLSDLVGEFMEYWGFKKIHGRIWTFVYLSEKPIDAAALIKHLGVSKALISLAMKELLDYRVLLESGTSPEGTRLYTANPELQKVITNVLRQREKIMMGKVMAAFNHVKKLPKDDLVSHNINPNRLKDMEKLLRNGEKGLEAIMGLL